MKAAYGQNVFQLAKQVMRTFNTFGVLIKMAVDLTSMQQKRGFLLSHYVNT